jgi:hypothetical protein
VLLQPLGHLSVCLESAVYRPVVEPANPNCDSDCDRPLNLHRSLTAIWSSLRPARVPHTSPFRLQYRAIGRVDCQTSVQQSTCPDTRRTNAESNRTERSAVPASGNSRPSITAPPAQLRAAHATSGRVGGASLRPRAWATQPRQRFSGRNLRRRLMVPPEIMNSPSPR